MTDVTSPLISFAIDTAPEAIPDDIVDVCKRQLVDALACAFAGLRSDRGRIALRFAEEMGGAPQASIIGSANMNSCVNAAFVNSELMNALDFDATPHSPPNIVPALLALAEARGCSGADLISALAVAHESAWRLYSAMSSFMSSYVDRGTSPDVFGNSNEAVLGAALGLARLMGLDHKQTANALGLTAYFCTLPVGKDWHTTPPPKPMVKYAPTGWLAKGALTACLLTEKGLTGNPAVLDGEYGFWRFYGASRWVPESVLDGLGSDWVSAGYNFKPYPCCRFFHSQLDCFIRLIDEHSLQPDEIEAVESLSLPFAANPDQMNVTTQSDAQFSLPYNLAIAAYRIPAGPGWQDERLRRDPAIRALMEKVTFGVHPDARQMKRENPRSWLACVTIKARGTSFRAETPYPLGTPVAGYELSREDMTAKFVNSAAPHVEAETARAVVTQLWALEEIADMAEVMKELARTHAA